MKIRMRVEPNTEARESKPRRRESVNEGLKAYYFTILPYVIAIIAMGIGLCALVDWIVRTHR